MTDLSKRSGYDIYEEGLAPLCDERIVDVGKWWGATRTVYCQPRYGSGRVSPALPRPVHGGVDLKRYLVGRNPIVSAESRE
jgi:hypothetical protein